MLKAHNPAPRSKTPSPQHVLWWSRCWHVLSPPRSPDPSCQSNKKLCVCGRFPFFTVGDSFFFLQLRVSLGENEPLLFSSTTSAHAGTALTNVSHYFTKSMHPPQHVSVRLLTSYRQVYRNWRTCEPFVRCLDDNVAILVPKRSSSSLNKLTRRATEV